MQRFINTVLHASILCCLQAISCDTAPASQPSEIGHGTWRGFWVDAFHPGIKSPHEVNQLIADLKRLDCNVVFAQVRRRGDAYFRKSVEPFTHDEEVAEGFDPLAYLCKQAHAENIQVHAWVNAMPVWRLDDPPPADRKHLFHTHGLGARGEDNWLTSSRSGEVEFSVGYFLDPGHPAVSEHLTRVVVDLVRNYPVDGIHLDYIRYPESQGDEETGYDTGYNSVSVARFNHRHGGSGAPDPTDPQWQQWRRDQVTQLVRRIRTELLEEKPQLLLSAALIAWRDGPRNESQWTRTAPYTEVFQDWHNWRKCGLLDITVPMNYDREHIPEQREFFENWIAFEKAYRYDSRLVIGLGAYLNSVENTASQAKQALSRSAQVPGADGINLFSYAVVSKGDSYETQTGLEELRTALAEFKPGIKPSWQMRRLASPVTGGVAGFLPAMDCVSTVTSIEFQRENSAQLQVLDVDGNGFFAALQLPPGRYTVRIPAVTGRTAQTPIDVRPGKISWIGRRRME